MLASQDTSPGIELFFAAKVRICGSIGTNVPFSNKQAMVSPLIHFRHAARKAVQAASSIQAQSAGSTKPVPAVTREGDTRPVKQRLKAPVVKQPQFLYRNVGLARSVTKSMRRSTVAEDEATMILLGGASE